MARASARRRAPMAGSSAISPRYARCAGHVAVLLKDVAVEDHGVVGSERESGRNLSNGRVIGFPYNDTIKIQRALAALLNFLMPSFCMRERSVLG